MSGYLACSCLVYGLHVSYCMVCICKSVWFVYVSLDDLYMSGCMVCICLVVLLVLLSGCMVCFDNNLVYCNHGPLRFGGLRGEGGRVIMSEKQKR